MSYLSSTTCQQAFAHLTRQRISGKFIGILFILKNMSYQTVLNTALGDLKYASYNKNMLKNDLKSYFSLNPENEPNVENRELESIIFINDFKNWVLRNLLGGQKISASNFAIFVFRNTFFEQPITKRELETRLRQLLNISDDLYQAWFLDSNSEETLNMEQTAFRWNNFMLNGNQYNFGTGHKSIVFTAGNGDVYSTAAAPHELTRGPFYQPIYASHENAIQFIPQAFFLQNSDEQIEHHDQFFNHSQIIYFGAPGTGKSNKIENDIFVDANENSLHTGLSSVEEKYKFRTTFHPDYDYAQFVGAYKPKTVPTSSQDDEDPTDNDQDRPNQKKTEITYEFTPQVFAKAYVRAWLEYLKATNHNPDATGEKVYLVIEEINRGNCAQIFGDIFQLLDRKNGHSAYSIDIDVDFAEHIEKQLVEAERADENVAAPDFWNRYKVKIQEWNRVNNGELAVAIDDDEFCKVALPPNLIILATMNTSDQSLFPMDSAFKRRFDWEYVPIDDLHPNARFNIVIDGDYSCPWLTFLKKVNENILAVTHSEDKQMGEFFIKPKDGSNIKFEEFRSKVLFYLWDSIYKDELDNEDALVFRLTNGNDVEKITFQKLFEGGSAQLERQKTLVKRIIDSIVPAAARAGAAREVLAEAGVENHEGQA